MELNIVRDFHTFIAYFQENNVKLTKSKELLTKKDLKALNRQMLEPMEPITKKEQQLDYPLLHLFYHIGITVDLLRKVKGPGGTYLQVFKERVTLFESLNYSEKYVALLEGFWLECDWNDITGGGYECAPDNIDFLFENLEKYTANKKIEMEKDRDLMTDLYKYGHFLYYFHYFGLWQVEIAEAKKGRSPHHFKAKAITLTELFDRIAEALVDAWSPERNPRELIASFELFSQLVGIPSSQEISEEEYEDEEEESLFEKLQAIFPEGELTKSFILKEKMNLAGSYLFKVMLNNSCWRTIQLSSSHTLFDLHKLIQKAFEFDDDHLYAFYMDGKSFSHNCYNSPMDNHGPFVTEAKIGTLKLYEGKEFLYLFDFGAEWHFSVEVKEIVEGNVSVLPMICEKQGKAPKQYSWEF